jgi:cytosine/adenosine deaminase-related metal-dependent hydrolase
LLTIHVADQVLFAGAGREGIEAVAVDGGVIAAMGSYEAMLAARPQARVRRWPGLMTAGLVNSQAAALLEAAYHPDPREAAELGTQPLTGEALAALDMDEARWGASARRGLQRMLAHGTTAVVGPFARPAVRSAVRRSGMRVRDRRLGRETETASLDPFAVLPLSAVLGGDLVVGGPADFAVFDVPADDVPARMLRLHGAGSCVATVLGGRLVYRRA